mgnify:CR=1 FL=1
MGAGSCSKKEVVDESFRSAARERASSLRSVPAHRFWRFRSASSVRPFRAWVCEGLGFQGSRWLPFAITGHAAGVEEDGISD